MFRFYYSANANEISQGEQKVRLLLSRDCGTQKNSDGTPMRKPAGESFFSIKDNSPGNEFMSEQNLSHHDKPLGKVRLRMKLVNQDKPPLDGAQIVERVLENLVGPMSHLVHGWSDHNSTAQHFCGKYCLVSKKDMLRNSSRFEV